MEIREPVEIRAIPVAVSADACILSGESGHWGNLRRLDTDEEGFRLRDAQSQNTDHVRTRSASLRWGEGRQDVKTYGHTGRSLPVWLFLLPENCISVLWPVRSGLNKGSR